MLIQPKGPKVDRVCRCLPVTGFGVFCEFSGFSIQIDFRKSGGTQNGVEKMHENEMEKGCR